MNIFGMKNSKKIVICTLFLVILLPGLAAHSSDRFDFAHTYLGLGVQHIPSGTSQVLNGTTSLENYEIPSRQNTRLFIGGLHFWNHVDFEISILLNGEVERNGIKTNVNHGSSAGFATHIYPFPLTPYTIRPFVGIGLLSRVGYQQGNNSDNPPTITFAQNPLKIGLAYRTKNHMIELGAQKLDRYKFDYYLSRTEKTNVKLSETSYWLSYKYIMEATKKVKERKIKNAFTLGVGLSSGGFIRKSPFNENQRPFLDGNVLQKGAFPEFSLGYYHYDQDIQFNLAYRTNTTQDKGFGIEQELSRSAVAFEIYKIIYTGLKHLTRGKFLSFQ